MDVDDRWICQVDRSVYIYYIFFILPCLFHQSEKSKYSTILKSYIHDHTCSNTYCNFGEHQIKGWGPNPK